MNRKWVRFLLSVCVWIAMGLIFAWQLHLLSLTNDMRMTWSIVVSWELTRWCLWIVLFPLVLRTIRRTSDRSGASRRFFLTNAGASILISALHLALFTIVYWCLIRIWDAFSPGGSLQAILARLPKTFHEEAPALKRIFVMIFIIDFHIGILIYWIILAGQQAIEYSRRAASLKTRLAEAQLDALKMQLHPHFLFNTLNSISALIQKDPQAADDMIGELGNFLRLTLQNRSGPEVTLEEELHFLESYLEIERIRFQDRLSVRMQIDPATLRAHVPNLILQPIIENAVRHGIARLNEPGHIEVHSSLQDSSLVLRVTDNGPGLPEQYSEGIGLRNVRERLKGMYGNRSRFHIANRDEGGVGVEIQIPLESAGGES